MSQANSSSTSKFEISGEGLFLDAFLGLLGEGPKIKVSGRAQEKCLQSRRYIENRIGQGEVIYGVNTGFGSFSSVRISDSQIEELQRNLIRSHSAGVGEPFSPRQTRGMMVLRANTLSRGHSAVRPQVIEKILEFLANDIIPVVPSQGSVGASGDLAPLSHLALALIGEGKAWKGSAQVPVAQLLQEKKIQPLVLKAKEGLSLINGCQVMTAVGLIELDRARNLLMMADVVGALSLEALRGSRKAFDPLISQTRPHAGEIATARNLRKLLGEGSAIGDSHIECARVQDAYSLRCMPAVHGAVKDVWQRTLSVLEVEANSSTDNPLVFAEEGKILSCGNFHGMPVALSLDAMTMAMTTLGSISEQRISKLVNTHMSDLPAFLTPDGGLNSGHMIVHVAAASLVSENKVLSHPASVDSIPTSADKEDHVSMGTIAARKLKMVNDNVTRILACEFLSSTQALDLLAPLKTTPVLESVKAKIRETVPFAAKDRVFSDDISAIEKMIEAQVFKGFTKIEVV